MLKHPGAVPAVRKTVYKSSKSRYGDALTPYQRRTKWKRSGVQLRDAVGLQERMASATNITLLTGAMAILWGADAMSKGLLLVILSIGRGLACVNAALTRTTKATLVMAVAGLRSVIAGPEVSGISSVTLGLNRRPIIRSNALTMMARTLRTTAAGLLLKSNGIIAVIRASTLLVGSA